MTLWPRPKSERIQRRVSFKTFSYVIHDRYARFPDLVSKPEVFRTWRAWPEISVYFLHKNPRPLPNPQVFESLDLFHYLVGL